MALLVKCYVNVVEWNAYKYTELSNKNSHRICFARVFDSRNTHKFELRQ